MPRRPIRCRYYTNSGEPIRGGCRRKGAGCSFVHPDDPAWADAEVSTSNPMNKGGDSSTSKPWSEGSRRGSTASSGWDTGGNGATNATNTSGGWGGSISTASEPAQRKNSSAIGPWGASPTDQNQTNANRAASKGGGDGWGTSSDKATGSAWGGGWGGSNDGGSWGAARNEARAAGWGNNDNDKNAGSGWGDTSTGASEGSWGNQDTNKNAESGWGSGGGGWGAGGNKKDTDKATGSGWGDASTGASGGSWGNQDTNKDAGSGWGSGSGGWGAGGNKKDTDKATGSGWGSASTGASGGSWGSQDTNKDAGSGWGGGGWEAGGNKKDAEKATGSGWGSTSAGASGGNQDTTKNAGLGWGSGGGGGGGGWGAVGNKKDTDKTTGSGWGSAASDGWGAGRGGDKNANKDAVSTWGGDKKEADKAAGSGWGSAAGNGRGAGQGGDKDATSSWGVSDPMIVDNSAEKGTEPERNKGKSKAVLAPPRIRIPDKENKPMMTGTNDVSLGSGKRWGDPRSSDLVTASTPITALTPVTTTTPIDSIRVKRKRDAAFDDKAEVFKEYTKAWERGVRARFLLAEAEVKRDRWFRTQKSACYARIGEAGRKILDGQRAECDEQVNTQRERVSAAITSLVDFHDIIASNIDLGQRYNLGEEMKKFLTDSKAYVDEVRALIVVHVLKEKDDAQPGDQKHSSGVVTALMDSVQSQVRDLEERFEQTQTELTLRHQRDIRSEVNELFQAKIAESRAARQCEIDRVASQPRTEIVIPPDVLKDQEVMAQQVRELDAKVPQAVEDIRNLLLRVDATTKRVIDLEQEVSANKETYEKQKRDMVAERESAERKIDGELEHLRNKFTELVASQPPAEPAACNTAEKLLETLLPTFEAVLDKFYEQEVVPTIKRTQRTAIDESNHYQEEAINVLWGKIHPAMNMVTGVSRWLDSQELRLTAPVEGEGTGAKL
ncbi:hypothetical protein JVU11DRAFT_583 [Chiua virens]|nr:hypothetical protein JVU11DRAFT_583 [Chiua virens]